MKKLKSIAAKPTDNPEAYDAYLRGLAYTLRSGGFEPANVISAQQYLKEAVRIDPKFALGWSLLSSVDSAGYITTALPRTTALRDEAANKLNRSSDFSTKSWRGDYRLRRFMVRSFSQGLRHRFALL